MFEECAFEEVETKLSEMGSEWKGVEVGYLREGEFLMPGYAWACFISDKGKEGD